MTTLVSVMWSVSSVVIPVVFFNLIFCTTYTTAVDYHSFLVVCVHVMTDSHMHIHSHSLSLILTYQHIQYCYHSFFWFASSLCLKNYSFIFVNHKKISREILRYSFMFRNLSNPILPWLSYDCNMRGLLSSTESFLSSHKTSSIIQYSSIYYTRTHMKYKWYFIYFFSFVMAAVQSLV
jgi:hypothetical protein